MLNLTIILFFVVKRTYFFRTYLVYVLLSYHCIVIKTNSMKKLLSIYKNIIIKEISYEKGDDLVQMKCILIFKAHSVDTTLLISQSDFNRILSKITLNGFEIKSDSIINFTLGDGTEIVEYNFENTEESVSLQNFNFNHQVKQISA